MIHLKRIFSIFFVCCISHFPFFASLATRTGLLFKNYSTSSRYYHTNLSTQTWREWRKKICGPANEELPMLKAKGIDGFSEKQIKYLTESEKTTSDIFSMLETETPFTKLGIQAIKESDKKIRERAISNLLSKKED